MATVPIETICGLAPIRAHPDFQGRDAKPLTLNPVVIFRLVENQNRNEGLS